MPVEMKMWRMDEGGSPRSLTSVQMPSEAELQRFLVEDPSLLGERLLVIGREVMTPFGTRIDILAMDGEGNLHVLELKRDRTPREVVAQILDYASWATSLSRDEILAIAARHLGEGAFEPSFEEVFGEAPPDELNSELRLTIVAATLDSSSERIVTYLRTFGVPINAVFFSYLEDEDRRYLARSWLAASQEGATPSAATGRSKKAAWNRQDWYVSFGGGRHWDDARRYGFVSAGGGKFYTQTLRNLPVGARIFVNVPGTGYVGVGRTLGPAERFTTARVGGAGDGQRLADQPLRGAYEHTQEQEDDLTEWSVPVRWIDTRPLEAAVWEKGMFANQNSACKLRQEFTLERLAEHFTLDEPED